MWYTDAKVSEYKQVELAKIIDSYLKQEDQEGLMRTIANKYIDEGVQKGMVQGMQIGETKGEYEVSKNMYNAGSDISFIFKSLDSLFLSLISFSSHNLWKSLHT